LTRLRFSSREIRIRGIISIVDVGAVFHDYGRILGARGYDLAADLDPNGAVDIVDAGIVAGAFDAPVFS